MNYPKKGKKICAKKPARPEFTYSTAFAEGFMFPFLECVQKQM